MDKKEKEVMNFFEDWKNAPPSLRELLCVLFCTAIPGYILVGLIAWGYIPLPF